MYYNLSKWTVTSLIISDNSNLHCKERILNKLSENILYIFEILGLSPTYERDKLDFLLKSGKILWKDSSSCVCLTL